MTRIIKNNETLIHVIETLGNIGNILKKIRLTIIEIGIGDGSLCYRLNTVTRHKSQYFLVDTPEVLKSAKPYLSKVLPEKKMYVYDEKDFEEKLDDKFKDYELILIPDYAISKMKSGIIFDLAINVASFQDMSEKQVEHYLSFLSGHMNNESVFYSWNKSNSSKVKQFFKTKRYYNYDIIEGLMLRVLGKMPLVPAKELICKK